MVKRSLYCLATSMLLVALLAVIPFGANLVAAGQNEPFAPRVIPDDATCGKCAMYPARYPQWQSQIVFTDGSMTPFDGCKCMFDFYFNMKKYDPTHSAEDIARIWVKDFNSGEWVEAHQAHYVIGGTMMGPMGKELIPFREKSSAEAFRQEHGGQLSSFDAINVDTLIPLMGMMHKKGNMNTQGQMHK